MSTFNRVIAALDRNDAGLTFLGPPGGGASARRNAPAPPELVSYARIARLVRGNAAHLAAQGIRRGDRVVMALETDLEHIVTVLALMAMGAVPVSVKPRRGSVDDYAADLGALAARFGIHAAYRSLPPLAGVPAVSWDPDAASDDAALVAAVDAEDVAFVQFSSGSLGDPKAIPIRHGALMHNLGSILAVDARTPGSIGYNFLPLSHDMGLVGGLLSNFVRQNPLYLSPVGHFLRRPIDFFARYERCDTVAMPDFALRYLVRYLAARARPESPRLLAGLRTIFCGAEPIRYETIAALVDAGAAYGFDPSALVFCYGMAEATLIVTARRFDGLDRSFREGPRGRVASVGAPVSETEVRIGSRRDDGAFEAPPPGVPGLIYVRGPSVFRGYAGGASLDDGWHDTGDLGFEDAGEIYVSGRAKDLIIINGENIFPGDIEAFVARLPGVAESLVMSEDDLFYVLVVLEPGATLAPVDVTTEIGLHFGAAPAGVATGQAKTIRRTTSGKPMRAATLADLRAAGVWV